MDLISRQDAIDAIDARLDQLKATRLPTTGSFNDGILDGYFRIRSDISTLPSAESKKGRWIQNDNGTYSCSLCHSWIPEEQYHYARFCLHCKADMRGEHNEAD